MISGWPTIQALVFIPTSMRLPIQRSSAGEPSGFDISPWWLTE